MDQDLKILKNVYRLFFTVSYSIFYPYFSAIDLADKAAAKLKMEITSKPSELDEIDRTVMKLKMKKLSLKNDTDKASEKKD